MKDYPWPSNIRELRNVVERTILCKESEIDAADLPEELRDHKQEPQQDKHRFPPTIFHLQAISSPH